MRRGEFVALMAMMFATIAFSLDAMLPALPEIARELTPEDLTRAPLILTTFVIGMGLGTFFVGPLSDALGRRRVMFMGAGLYTLSAIVAWLSQSFEVILVSRFLQGIGAAGPRVVCIAIIRDLFAGREMARILSIVMMIFTLVPAIAPAMGAVIIDTAGWRAIFLAFVTFSVISMLWMGTRLPETLPESERRPLRLPLMMRAVQEMLLHPVVRLSIIVQSLSMSMLLCTLMMVQPIYDQVYDKADSFPYWFGGLALLSAAANVLNALLVVRLGMRRLVTFALAVQVVFSGTLLGLSGGEGSQAFAVFAVWQAFMFFQIGLTIGNLNAIAMEPMGHIAGMAASVIGAISTVMAAVIASPIGTLFDGTIWPLIGGVFVLSLLSVIAMLYMGRIEARQPA
jgi:DHA1 family bicyclomycin/chloramphenicol resistance-like MFS transporter